MPLAEGYIDERGTFTNGEFVREKPQPSGKISIKKLDKRFIKKHGVKVGDITPWTNLKVTR